MRNSAGSVSSFLNKILDIISGPNIDKLLSLVMAAVVEISGASISIMGVLSVPVVPLKAGDKVVGAIYLDNTRSSGVFDKEKAALIKSFANKVAGVVASVLGETVRPRNFNTLRRIRGEDGTVIEEQEQFTELASNEFLLKQLHSLLDAGGRQMLESLPDGIHSGLAKERAKGVFFYFQAPGPSDSGKLHFWKYYDLNENRIIDNRFVIANLPACDRDTPRVVGDYGVFQLQEKVIEDILQSHQEQQSPQAVPKKIDPLQQTVATVIQNYLNHPDVKRAKAIEAIRFLNRPMPSVQVKELRKRYMQFQKEENFSLLLEAVLAMEERYGTSETAEKTTSRYELKREDLRLICFDHICS